MDSSAPNAVAGSGTGAVLVAVLLAAVITYLRLRGHPVAGMRMFTVASVLLIAATGQARAFLPPPRDAAALRRRIAAIARDVRGRNEETREWRIFLSSSFADPEGSGGASPQTTSDGTT